MHMAINSQSDMMNMTDMIVYNVLLPHDAR
jgi:hypothetical protein